MIVSDLAIREHGDGYELSADVTYERQPSESHRVWFRWPAELGAPRASGDAFLAGLFVPAMAVDEDLTIEAPVSPQLLEAAHERIQPILRCWYPRLDATVIRPASTQTLPPAEPERTAALFSGGVDSWYSVAKHRESLDALVTIHGFEISIENEARWRVAVSHMRSSTATLGVPLIEMQSNLSAIGSRVARKRLSDRGTPFVNLDTRAYLGSYLVAIGQALQHRFPRFLIQASTPYEWTEPYGTHPFMEPNWSTDTLEIIFDGCEASRIDKIRYLAAEWPEAVRTVRVCVDKVGDDLNCGACVKCVRTMAELRAAGATDLCESFEVPLDLEAIRRGLFPRNRFWADLGREATIAGDRELAAAVAVFMDEKFYWRRFVDNAGRHAARLLRRGA